MRILWQLKEKRYWNLVPWENSDLRRPDPKFFRKAKEVFKGLTTHLFHHTGQFLRAMLSFGPDLEPLRHLPCCRIVQGDVLGERFRGQGVDITTKRAAEGGGWMIITSSGSSVANLIETGRRFERTALLAGERNIALHPMTQILQDEKGRREIASNHGKGVTPQFVLRPFAAVRLCNFVPPSCEPGRWLGRNRP